MLMVSSAVSCAITVELDIVQSNTSLYSSCVTANFALARLVAAVPSDLVTLTFIATVSPRFADMVVPFAVGI
jgi:hypothetical protein